MSQGEVDTMTNIDIGRKRHRPSSLNLSTARTPSSGNSSSSTTANKPLAYELDSMTSQDDNSRQPVNADDNSDNNSTSNSGSDDDLNNNLAMRIVSPGLPQLNDEMKNTMKLSQQIQLQQKSLIASRNNGNEDKSFDYDDDIETDSTHYNPDLSHNQETIQPTNNQETQASNVKSSTISIPSIISPGDDDSVTSPVPDDLSDCSNLSSQVASRSLKRKHVPKPLNITTENQAPKPAIHSAPMNFNKTIKPPGKKLSLSTPKSAMKNQFLTHLTPHKSNSPHPNKRMRLVQPYSSSAQYFPRSKYYYQQYTPQPSANFYNRFWYQPGPPPFQFQPQKLAPPAPSSLPGIPLLSSSASSIISSSSSSASSTNNKGNLQSKVVDIYHGDLVKNAPFKSQPLSAQKDFFDHKYKRAIEEDRLPASEDELKEMEEKYRHNNVQINGVHEGQQYNNLYSDEEIFGSINLMNEKIYNFKIFNSPPSESTTIDDNKLHNDNDITTNASNSGNSSIAPNEDQHSSSELKSPVHANIQKTSTTNSNVDSTKPSTEKSTEKSTDELHKPHEILAKEKEKFLKICSKSWDEFINNRFDV